MKMEKVMKMLAATAFGLSALCTDAAAVAADEEGEVIKMPGVGHGEIVLINAQGRARREWLEGAAAYFEAMCGIAVRVAEGRFALPPPAPERAENLALYVVDDGALPMSLVAVEAGWGMVNVAPLQDADEEVFKSRVRKELSRGFALLCGGYASTFNNLLMTGMRTAADLDGAPNSRLPADTIGGCLKCLKRFGFERFVSATYREACEQGWAPVPTNDVQRAIWERVKANKERGPTNPITIEPPKKK